MARVGESWEFSHFVLYKVQTDFEPFKSRQSCPGTRSMKENTDNNNNNNNNNLNIFMQDCCFSFKKKNCYQCRSCKKLKMKKIKIKKI